MNLRLRIIGLFFPERCPYCNKTIEPESIACPSCAKLLKDKQHPIIRGARGFRCVTSFHYDAAVRRALIRIKFRGRTQHIRQLAAVLAEDIRSSYQAYPFDLITYVPMHPKDERIRGYNQSELLCRELSKLLGLPLVDTLQKIKRTKKQHKLTYSERRKNLSGAFALIDKERVKGKRILLIDDIVTSGYTLGTCCKKLNESKPALICCAAIADAGDQHAPADVI